MGKVLFGPAGNSESFYNEGHSSTMEAPKWVKERGLDLFENTGGTAVDRIPPRRDRGFDAVYRGCL